MNTKIVKVQIAVAVDKNGKGNASGSSIYNNQDFAFIVDDLEEGESRFIVECELPIPEAVVVQGGVTVVNQSKGE